MIIKTEIDDSVECFYILYVFCGFFLDLFCLPVLYKLNVSQITANTKIEMTEFS